ncbi:aspartic peptidase domain-containing protein [Mycena epipterygia]|nr:aspartic peptidase domain-containing protein [Mycena epipterygia]
MTISALFVVFVLFVSLAGDICTALPLPSTGAKLSPISPFITIPLVKSYRLGDSKLLPAVVHKNHVRRGRQRLALMSRIRSSSAPAEPPIDNYTRHTGQRLSPPSIGTLSRRHRHSAAISGIIAARKDRGEFSDSGGIVDPLDGLQMKKADDKTKSTSSIEPGTSQSDAGPEPEPEPEPAPARQSDSEVTKSHRPTFSNSSALDTEANDIGYLATVFLGTPLRPFRMLVDSGSADMWVGGEGCKGDDGANCGDHEFLGRNSSSSFNDTGDPWETDYGTGHVSGNLVTDQVGFSGFMLQKHTFGVASHESSGFTSNEIPLDGVLGCAKSGLSRQQTPTLVTAFRSAGLIEKNIISYKIPRQTDDKNDGEITLGSLDPSKYDASSLVHFKNVNTGGFWAADLDAVKVNGKNLGLVGRRCVFDTGTTLFIAPKQDVDTIHNSIPGAKFDNSSNAWTVPCNTDAVLSLVFAGKSFHIQPGDLAFLPLDPKNATGACTSAIAEGDVSEGLEDWLVGDTFLKNVYFSTNEDTDQISLARLAK